MSGQSYGWRGRVAHIAPSRGDAIVYEFYKVAPPGVFFLNTTGTVRNLRTRDLTEQVAQLENAVMDVVDDHVDLIVTGGSPLITTQGYGSEKRIAERLTALCDIPCVTSMQLEVEALRAVGSGRPVLATPYPAHLDERLIVYLGQAGFDVQGCKGLGIEHNSTIGLLEETAALDIGRQAAAAAPNADAVFLPCGRWPTLDASVALEREIDKPVVSATQALFYGIFKRLNIHEPFSGRGRLLESLGKQTSSDTETAPERATA